MHEYSIVQNLLDLCEQHAAAHHATIVHKVIVGVGRLSSVEPQLLKTAFDTFKEETIAAHAEFEIRTLELKAICDACGQEFEPEMTDISCKFCGSLQTRLTSGDELLLLSLELE